MRAPAVMCASACAAALTGALAGCVSWTAGIRRRPSAAVARNIPIRRRCGWSRPSSGPSGRLASLARALPAPGPESGLPDANSLPAALRRPVTVDWSGPIETLAADLARRAGYGFAQAGRAPARPLIVAVEAKDEPLIAVLRDLGLRAGSAATLTVDAANRTVLLDWTAPRSASAAAEDG